MKRIKIILGLVLLASVSTFAQSPRIKLNQITKDTVKGSVLISSPSDSGMVYSRDFYVAYGADTVLILYGDTLAATSGIISSVISDGVTITGDGTTGNELKVDTATVVSTIQGLVDTLSSRGYLTANQTITLSGDVTGSGTTAITATVVDDSHNHIISNVDFLQDSLNNKTNTDFSNVSGTLPVANGGTGSATQNFVDLTTTQTVGGAKTFTSALTQSGGDVNFDSGTLFVDESADLVGIGETSLSSFKLTVKGILPVKFDCTSNVNTLTYGGVLYYRNTSTLNNGNGFQMALNNSNNALSEYGYFGTYIVDNTAGSEDGGFIFAPTLNGARTESMRILNNGYLGIGTTSPSEKLDVDGNARFRSIGSGASAGALHYTSTGVLTTNTSDARLKTNLQPLENTLNKLLNINTYTFNWIDETDRVDLGMIAQEVEQIFPNLVFTNNVDGYKGIHYDKFSSILTKAIQEQQEQIETLQIELDAKSTEIDQLKTLITDLTNRLIILENK